MNAWIGVDLDGTLAEYDGWQGATHIGKPVPLMVERVKAWLAEGKTVKVFTARASGDGTQERELQAIAALAAIRAWCYEHIGVVLEVTCCKDYAMEELWDDRAVQVVKNTGRRADGLE